MAPDRDSRQRPIAPVDYVAGDLERVRDRGWSLVGVQLGAADRGRGVVTKSIWVPKSDLKVTVSDGKVTVWDEMVMSEKSLASQPPGFTIQPERSGIDVGIERKAP